MRKIIVASDSKAVRQRVRSALASNQVEVIEIVRGQDMRDAVAEHQPDLAVVDLQIDNMGGFAVALDLHLEEGGGRLPHVPIVLLLDREADRFLAKRAQVEAEIVKPFDAVTLQQVANDVMLTNA